MIQAIKHQVDGYINLFAKRPWASRFTLLVTSLPAALFLHYVMNGEESVALSLLAIAISVTVALVVVYFANAFLDIRDAVTSTEQAPEPTPTEETVAQETNS